MADFFKLCFPRARKRSEDDEIELVSAAALPGTKRSQHEDRRKVNISRPKPQGFTVASTPSISKNPYPYVRRPSEYLQDLIVEETQEDMANDVAFSMVDRAHAHVLRDLNSALQHSSWAVSGSYAEALWACPRGKRRNILSIMCQSSSRDTTKVWLTSKSLFTVSTNDENVLQYRGDLMGAEPVFVRIRWVSDRKLQRLQTIESTFSYRESPFEPVKKVRIVLLSLPALADNLAWSWVQATERQARDEFAADLFSVLKRIIDLDFSLRGSGPLTVGDNSRIMRQDFWTPFTKAYPHAPSLFAQCGLPFPSFDVVSSQPTKEKNMKVARPALRLDSFQKPRSAPTPLPPMRDHGRSLTRPSSPTKQSSSSKALSSKRKKPSSSSKTLRPSAKSKSKMRHLSKDEIHPALRKQRLYRELEIPVSPEPSPQRPVHPANILHSEPEPRSKFSALFGLKESPETVARRRQEQLENDRAARRASEKLAAKVQRNREREREREWLTRKQAEGMGLHEPPKKPRM